MPRLQPSHAAWVLALLAFIALVVGRPSSRAPRTLDLSNLKQIGLASIIYAHENEDRLPEAADVWEYAYLLARSAGLNEPTFWSSRLDPAWSAPDHPYQISVGKAPHTQPNPEFRLTKPSIAIPVAKLDLTMPATTPIAWTRGLQADGTWAKHSPYTAETAATSHFSAATSPFTATFPRQANNSSASMEKERRPTSSKHSLPGRALANTSPPQQRPKYGRGKTVFAASSHPSPRSSAGSRCCGLHSYFFRFPASQKRNPARSRFFFGR